MDEPDEKNSQHWTAKNAYFLSLYFIGTGSLYLWGYWSHFGINILDYINITDIIKVSAYPVAICSTMLVISITISEALRPRLRDTPAAPSDASNLPPLTEQNIKNRRRIEATIAILFLGIAICISIYLDFYWMMGSLIAAIPIELVIMRRLVRAGIIKRARKNAGIAFVIILLPFISWGWGKQKAHDIEEGKFYFLIVDSSTDKSTTPYYENSLRYIGNASDYFFLYNPTNKSTIIKKLAEDSTLEIKRNESIGISEKLHQALSGSD